MALFGYTSGGSPIFWGGSGNGKKTRGEKNTRYSCSNKACNHKTTKNQAVKLGGVCFTCKQPLSGYKP